MTITTTEKNSQGQAQRYDVRYLDDAADPAAAVFYPGFRPKYVKAVNLTDRLTYEWYTGMAEGDYFYTIANGTRTLETNDVMVVEADSGARASITLVDSITVQNKQWHIVAEG
jgi:hypothetical protein